MSVGVHVFIDGDEPVWTVYGSPKLGMIQDCPDFRTPEQLRAMKDGLARLAAQGVEAINE